VTSSPRYLGRLIAAAVLILLPVIYFYPAVLGEVALVQGDGWMQNFGARALTGQMLARGWMPLWNPFIFAGSPHLAGIYAGALYPPNWIFAALPPGTAMNVLVITTFHCAIIGTYLYARRIGSDRAGALVAAVVFAFGGYMVTHIGHTARIAAAAWLPWILLALECLYVKASWRWIALGSLFVALQIFAGDPQMTAYAAIVCLPYLFFSLFAREERERRGRFAAAAAAMTVCGALISAPQVLPTLELIPLGERATPSYEFFGTFSLPPRQALSLIFPFFFGGAALPPYRVPYWGQWLAAVNCGYVGMLALLLVLISMLGRGRPPLVWFWAAVAAISLALSFGAYLPFGLNHLPYLVPGLNLFRGLYRHQFELTFSLGVLAGLGLTRLARLDRRRAWTEASRAALLLGAAVVLTAVAYRFGGDGRAAGALRPEWAASLTNAEAWVPLIFFAASAGAILLLATRRGRFAKCAALVVLLLDLASWGHFFAWRAVSIRVAERLADPPAVRDIKARETDPDAFRVLSHMTLPWDFAANWPEDESYDLINFPNISVMRGLRSVNGYDVLRLSRVGALAGTIGSASEGFVQEAATFGPVDRGLDLLNVKYLLLGRGGSATAGDGLRLDGVRFSQTPLNLTLGPNRRQEITPPAGLATEIAIVSTMTNSAHLADGDLIAKVLLYPSGGTVIVRELRAGRDTAEWAYDRADVRRSVRHRRARVAESTPAAGFEAHRYVARLAFPRAAIERIALEYARPDAELLILRATLYDDETGTSRPLDTLQLPEGRWRKLSTHGPVDLYLNTGAQPRAWFVNRVEVVSSAEALGAIKGGKVPGGAPFDPAEVALLDVEGLGGRPPELPPVGPAAGAQVEFVRYEPQRIELSTRATQPAFLVLSEIDYPGWEAKVDGRPTRIFRTDYTLRGVAVPPGSHRIELGFRPPAVRRGLILAAVGAGLLAVGAIIDLIRRRKLSAPSSDAGDGRAVSEVEQILK